MHAPGALSAAPANIASSANRMQGLDGLRGIAATMVMVYHFAGRWTEKNIGVSAYPFGDDVLGWVPGLDLLAYGITLFFLLSGFVIVMTLERASSFGDFVLKRIARLWPVMLFCATATALIVNFSGIHERIEPLQGWHVEPVEYVSSIFFIDPAVIGGIIGQPDLRWVDGVYWTLWCEVRFYIIVALVFAFTRGDRAFLWGWCVVQACSLAAMIANGYTATPTHWALDLLLQPVWLVWFTLGICVYFFAMQKRSLPLWVLSAIAVATLIAEAGVSSVYLFGGLILVQLAVYAGLVLVFVMALVRSPITPILTNRWVLLLGVMSYPLYMFHERVGIVAMMKLADIGVPLYLILPLTIAATIAAAYLIHRFIETPSRRAIVRAGMPAVKWLEARLPMTRFSQRLSDNVQNSERNTSPAAT